MKPLSLIWATALATSLAGCMMPPVRPEVPHLGSDLSIGSSSPDQAKLVLVNSSSKLLHGADATGRINVRIDGKAVGGPNIGEFVQIQVPKGKHVLEVWHRDLINFRSEREVHVDQDLVIELKATPFSNKILVQTTMPAGDFRPHVVAMDDGQKPNVFNRSAYAVKSYVQSFR